MFMVVYGILVAIPGSIMGLSGSKPVKNKITPRDKAILEVKVQRDRLKQYQKKVNKYRKLE